MRKILFIITSVLIFIGIGAYYMLNTEDKNWNIKYSLSNETTNISYEEMRAKLEETAQKNVELYNTAIQQNNIELCNGISIESKKIECLDMTKINIANKEGNIEACQNLSNTGTVMLCRDTLTMTTAQSKGDIKLCATISDDKRKEFCEDGITELILKENIQAKTVTRDFCAGLGKKYQNNCFREIQSVNENELYKEAIVSKDINLCNKIQSVELKDSCSDAVYLKIAVSTENSLLCDNILDTSKSQYCREQLSKNIDITLYKSAISSNSLDDCRDIKNTNLHSRCTDTIIFTTVKRDQNNSLCGSLSNTGLLTSCEQLVQQ